jgi:hypothetical protein
MPLLNLGGKTKKLDDMMDLLLLISGAVNTFIGISGLMILLYSVIPMSDALAVGFGFLSLYTLLIGLFLLAFHKHIIVKPKKHYYYDSRYFG